MHRFHRAAAAAAFVIAASGCLDRSVAEVETDDDRVEIVEFRVGQNRNLDLLFVIDDSRSMLGEQALLARNFDILIGELETLEGGLPDVHIGVVSTDLGTPPHRGTCADNADAAVLQASPREPGCTPPADLFIRDYASPGGGRDRNYDGALEDAFSCIARLGRDGCGFEQPLEAMRRALDPEQTPQNAGFRRDNARLAVVFVTDEDDCSAIDFALFDGDDPSLGALHSFRCFEYGVTCDAGDLRQFGTYTGCEPARDSSLIAGVDGYVDFLRGLVAFPDQDLVVAAIAGTLPAGGITVDEEPNPAFPPGTPRVQPSCVIPDAETGEQNGATPPVRLAAFVESFAHHQLSSICDPELDGALAEVGEALRPDPGFGCLQGAPADLSACVVSEIRSAGRPERSERPVPACSDPADPQGSAALPCYTALGDPGSCGDTASGIAFQVHYADGEVVPDGTQVTVQCELE